MGKMRTYLLLIVPLLSAVLLVMLLIPSCNRNNGRIAVLQQYNLCFGDSPRAVLAKLPNNSCLIEKVKLLYTNQTVYTYDANGVVHAVVPSPVETVVLMTKKRKVSGI
ncbi:MAG: hypothetical protein IKH56_06680 [Oscillospiraceae bacterium]|nr:hypothetical protein [Oscillospiraceae bacterium]